MNMEVRMPDPYSISSQTIKKLTIYYDCEYGSDFMSFDGPSLVSLDCSDYALYVYPLVNLESLVEAKLVDLCYSKRIKRPDISGLLVGISNVQTLHLSVGSVDVSLPIFFKEEPGHYFLKRYLLPLIYPKIENSNVDCKLKKNLIQT